MENTYNYRTEVLKDIINAMQEERKYNNDCNEWDIDDWTDCLWTLDDVTGNGSGSYTFSAYRAKEYVLNSNDGLELIGEMVDNGSMDKDQVSLYEIDWESIDVSIRCYLLYELIGKALGESEED